LSIALGEDQGLFYCPKIRKILPIFALRFQLIFVILLPIRCPKYIIN